MYILFKKQLHLVYIYGGEILHFLPTTVHVSKYLFFGFIHAALLSLSIYQHPQGRMECKKQKEKRERTRPKMRELHELLYTKMVKSGTIRLTSVLLYIMFVQFSLMTFVAFVKLLCLLLMMFVALQGLSLMTFVALQDFLYMRFVTISRIMTFVANYDVCRLEGLSYICCSNFTLYI